VLLQVIRDKTDLLGDLFAGLADAAWGVLTFLVVPILVVEDIGPIEAIKRSGSLLKQTWGEQVIGNAGIGLVMGLITFAAIATGAMLVVMAASIGGIVLAIPVGAVAVLVVAAIIATGSALNGIYRAALYRLAAEGASTGVFSDDLIRNAFVPKTSR